QRVEPARGLVEEEQVRARRERRDQLNLLAVSLPQGAHLLPRVEPKPLDELVAISNVDAAAQPGEELERLGASQRRPEERLARDVRDATVRLDRRRPRVDAEELGTPAARAVQAQQQADRRRLAGAVRPQEPVHLT